MLNERRVKSAFPSYERKDSQFYTNNVHNGANYISPTHANVRYNNAPLKHYILNHDKYINNNIKYPILENTNWFKVYNEVPITDLNNWNKDDRSITLYKYKDNVLDSKSGNMSGGLININFVPSSICPSQDDRYDLIKEKKRIYSKELLQQIEADKIRKLNMKLENEKYEKLLESDNYNPYGRGGCGAPNKDAQDNILALRNLSKIYDPYPLNVSPLNVNSDFNKAIMPQFLNYKNNDYNNFSQNRFFNIVPSQAFLHQRNDFNKICPTPNQMTGLTNDTYFQNNLQDVSYRSKNNYLMNVPNASNIPNNFLSTFNQSNLSNYNNRINSLYRIPNSQDQIIPVSNNIMYNNTLNRELNAPISYETTNKNYNYENTENILPYSNYSLAPNSSYLLNPTPDTFIQKSFALENINETAVLPPVIVNSKEHMKNSDILRRNISTPNLYSKNNIEKTTFARGGNGIFGQPLTDSEKLKKFQYNQELQKQMMAKKIQLKFEKEREKMEDERIDKQAEAEKLKFEHQDNKRKEENIQKELERENKMRENFVLHENQTKEIKRNQLKPIHNNAKIINYDNINNIQNFANQNVYNQNNNEHLHQTNKDLSENSSNRLRRPSKQHENSYKNKFHLLKKDIQDSFSDLNISNNKTKDGRIN